ncbi:hypothetical protein [Paenibacillus sp. UMB4589-SE434]|uniref:hypothetical protein n=1 Tax=Paenibacillus sp. UMB4589-SE434 TaxID=3046314 RepID=UPI00254BC4E8|nr:hypothetical protein [Paenibacillus sp. UMB4589-SE434]MDK8181718.1 hypothetical protein [Paenibacillus sp. UMB4589-SE434]
MYQLETKKPDLRIICKKGVFWVGKNNGSKDERPHSTRLFFLNVRHRLTLFSDKLFMIAVWDNKWKLHWLRYLLIPIIIVPSYRSFLLWLSDIRQTTPDELLSGFHVLYQLTLILAKSYVWLSETGVMILIILPLFALGFLRTLSNISKRDKELGIKVTKKVLILLVLDFIFLYNGVKYLIPWFQDMMRVMVILLFISQIYSMKAYMKHQKETGPYDPDQIYKREMRKIRKKKMKMNNKS